MHGDRTAFRMIAERAGRFGRRAAETAGARLLGDDQIDRAVAADGQHVVLASDVRVGLAMLDIGPVAADSGKHRLAGFRMPRHLAGQREQQQRRLKVNLGGAETFRQGLALGLLALSQLDIRAEPPVAGGHVHIGRGVLAERADTVDRGGLAIAAAGRELARVFALRIVRAPHKGAELAQPQRQRSGLAGRTAARVGAVGTLREDMGSENAVEGIEHLTDPQVLGAVQSGRELLPEAAQDLLPVDLVVRDAVEILLEARREVVFDVAGEEALEERRHQHALVLGMQALLVDADIFAVLEDGESGGVGRRPADPEFLHALDEGGLGIARRRLGEVLGGGDLFLLERISGRHFRQPARLVVVRVLVLAFLVELQEAVELHHLAGGAQLDPPVGAQRGPGGGEGRDVDRCALEFGRFHLARDGADPDQLVQPGLLGLEMASNLGGQAAHVGRTDRLVRLLGILLLGHVFPRRGRHIGVAIFGCDHAAGGGDRLGGHVDAVGAHIGDEANRLAAGVDALIQPLGHLHGAGGGHAELAAGLLLQRRGGEGRGRIAPRRLGLDAGDREPGGLEIVAEGLGLLRRPDVQPCDLAAVGAGQPGVEGRPGRRRQGGDQRPVFTGDEGLDLALAVANEAQRHRLHAAGRPGTGELAPQHRREAEPDQIIQRPAGQIGVDQRLVDLAWMGHRLADGILGDRVEGDALNRHVLQHPAGLQSLDDVPGDGLALTVRVGGKNEPIRALHGAGDVGDTLGGLGVDLPQHGEILVRLHRTVLRRQIADVAEGSQHLVARAQIFDDRLGLGRRLDDDDFHLKHPRRGPCSGHAATARKDKKGMPPLTGVKVVEAGRAVKWRHEGRLRTTVAGTVLAKPVDGRAEVVLAPCRASDSRL